MPDTRHLHDRTATIHTAIVVTGGDAPDPERVGALLAMAHEDRIVIAADSGAAHALALGLVIDVAVGDFDSLDPEFLRQIEERGTEVRRHPVAKDATDLELALDVALGAGAERIVVIGGYGGRFDHLLANALVLASDRYREVTLDAIFGSGLVHVVHPQRERRIAGVPGDYVTVLPVHGAAADVHLDGMRWPLAGETLHAGSTRGVSNQFVDTTVTIRVGSGVVVVIVPGDRPSTQQQQQYVQPSGPSPQEHR